MSAVTAAGLAIDARRYLGLEQVTRIAPVLDIALSEHCFAPLPDDPDADWLASVATPAFHLLARTRPPAQRRSFLSIGTGCGLDALAAAEILGATELSVTDIFPDIVAVAAHNIRANLRPGCGAALLAAETGDLVAPLAGRGLRFDLAYENLPNTPVADAAALAEGQTVAGYLGPRAEALPRFVQDQLLVLHYLALVQVRPLLNPGGAVLSTIGGRIPLQSFLDLADAAGFAGRLLTHGWKKQADPAAYIPGYVAMERQGLGPFRFHRVEDLRAVFRGLTPEAAGRAARDIEAALAPRVLTAEAALAAHRSGIAVGHTVVALLSELP